MKRVTAQGKTAPCRHCPVCDLRFVDRDFLPGPAAERARYLLHRNTLADPGYRAFLEPALRAVRDRVPPPARLLDYGSGPEPACDSSVTAAIRDRTDS